MSLGRLLEELLKEVGSVALEEGGWEGREEGGEEQERWFREEGRGESLKSQRCEDRSILLSVGSCCCFCRDGLKSSCEGYEGVQGGRTIRAQPSMGRVQGCREELADLQLLFSDQDGLGKGYGLGSEARCRRFRGRGGGWSKEGSEPFEDGRQELEMLRREVGSGTDRCERGGEGGRENGTVEETTSTSVSREGTRGGKEKEKVELTILGFLPEARSRLPSQR